MERSGANKSGPRRWKTLGWISVLLLTSLCIGLAIYYLTPLSDESDDAPNVDTVPPTRLGELDKMNDYKHKKDNLTNEIAEAKSKEIKHPIDMQSVLKENIVVKDGSDTQTDKSDNPTALEAEANNPVAPVAEADNPTALEAEANNPVAPVAEADNPVAPVAEADNPVAPVAEANNPVAPVAEANNPNGTDGNNVDQLEPENDGSEAKIGTEPPKQNKIKKTKSGANKKKGDKKNLKQNDINELNLRGPLRNTAKIIKYVKRESEEEMGY